MSSSEGSNSVGGPSSNPQLGGGVLPVERGIEKLGRIISVVKEVLGVVEMSNNDNPIVQTLKLRKIEQVFRRNFLIFLTVFVVTAFITVPLLISVCRQIEYTEQNLVIANNPPEKLSKEDEYYLRKNFLVQKNKIENLLGKNNFSQWETENRAQFIFRVMNALKQTDLIFDENTTEVVAKFFIDKSFKTDGNRDWYEFECEHQYGNFVEFMHQCLGIGDSPCQVGFEREVRRNFSGNSYWNNVLEGKKEMRLEADLYGQWYPRPVSATKSSRKPSSDTPHPSPQSSLVEDEYYLRKNFLVQKNKIEGLLVENNFSQFETENRAQFIFRVMNALKQTDLIFDENTTEVVAKFFIDKFFKTDENRDWYEFECEHQYGNFVEFMHQCLGIGDSPCQVGFEREVRRNFSGNSYWNDVLEGKKEMRLEADLYGQWYPRSVSPTKSSRKPSSDTPHPCPQSSLVSAET